MTCPYCSDPTPDCWCHELEEEGEDELAEERRLDNKNRARDMNTELRKGK